MLSLLPLPDSVTICKSNNQLDSWGLPIQEENVVVPARVRATAEDDKSRATVYLRGTEQITVNDAVIVAGVTMQVVKIDKFRDLSGAVLQLKVSLK